LPVIERPYWEQYFDLLSRLSMAATAVPATAVKSTSMESAERMATSKMSRAETMAIEVVSAIPPSVATEVRAINRTKKSVTSASAE
jgi:hypothetical protein